MSRDRAANRPMSRRDFLLTAAAGIGAIAFRPETAKAAPVVASAEALKGIEAGPTRSDRYVTIAGVPTEAISTPLITEAAPRTNRMQRVEMPACACPDGTFNLEMGSYVKLDGASVQTAEGPRVLPTVWNVKPGEQFRVNGGEFAVRVESANGTYDVRVPQIDDDESGSRRANFSVTEVNILGGATGAKVTVSDSVPGHCLVMSQYGNEVNMGEVAQRRSDGEKVSEVRTAVAIKVDTGACQTIRAYKNGGDFQPVAALTNIK